MSNEPSDEIVEHDIKAVVANMKTAHMRPNKLRKIVCKQIKDTNWTQYQRVIDGLIQDKSLQTKKVDGESVVLSLRVGGSADKKTVAKVQSPLKNQKIMTHEMEVPYDIILYLTRKGRRKQTNIEDNTKTALSFDADTMKAMRSHVSSRDETSKNTITKQWNSDDGSDEKEAKGTAKKQVHAANGCISRMILSFQDNPDHFTRKKAGGTFAEQDEAKQRKLDIAKKRKKHSSTDATDVSADVVEGDEAPKKKKRKRKFY
jgi:hypothetical protein